MAKKSTGKKKSGSIWRWIFAVLFIGAAFTDGFSFVCLIIGLALLAPEIIAAITVFAGRKSSDHIAETARSAASFSAPESAKPPAPAMVAKPSSSLKKQSYEPYKPQRFLLIPQRLQGQRLSYKYEQVNIHSPQECLDGLDLATLPLATRTELRQEPENQYDSKAVAVYMGDVKIGYLYKGTHQDMANDYIAAGLPIFSAIQGVDDDNNKISISLAFYKNPSRTGEVKTFRLSANKNNAMQEAIGLASEGEYITYSYDVDKDKYLASAGDDIGYFPKSAESYLEKEPDVIISSIDTTDDGKLSVSVDILL